MDTDRQDTLSTYRHLRLAMAFVLVLLLVAVAQRALTAPPGLCFEGSISAYYFTSARAVFVGALCALGTCLIVYRGNTDAEDVALNASGALAFVVAFVPTGVPSELGVRCSASNVPTPDQLDVAVTNNMVAYFVVALPALVTAVVLTRRARSEVSPVQHWGQAGLGLALVVGAVSFALWPEGFRDRAHTVAAILTFLGILAVVGFNAWGAREARRISGATYEQAYEAIALLMVVTFVVVGGAHLLLDDWRHGVLVIEALLLLEFLAFWIVQTVELWDTTRRELPESSTGALAA